MNKLNNKTNIPNTSINKWFLLIASRIEKQIYQAFLKTQNKGLATAYASKIINDWIEFYYNNY